jgi:hypothetical protein
VPGSISEITKFNIKIGSRTLFRTLLMDPYKNHINRIASYLHLIRACASSSYLEYRVSGFYAIIKAHQSCDSSNNTSKMFFMEPADKSIQYAGSKNTRVQAFITSEILLQNLRVCNTAGVKNGFKAQSAYE